MSSFQLGFFPASVPCPRRPCSGGLRLNSVLWKPCIHCLLLQGALPDFRPVHLLHFAVDPRLWGSRSGGAGSWPATLRAWLWPLALGVRYVFSPVSHWNLVRNVFTAFSGESSCHLKESQLLKNLLNDSLYIEHIVVLSLVAGQVWCKMFYRIPSAQSPK